MVARYRKVAQTDNPDEQDVKKKRADRIERITSKLHALVWIAASVAIIVYTQIFQNAVSDERVNRLDKLLLYNSSLVNHNTSAESIWK